MPAALFVCVFFGRIIKIGDDKYTIFCYKGLRVNKF